MFICPNLSKILSQWSKFPKGKKLHFTCNMYVLALLYVSYSRSQITCPVVGASFNWEVVGEAKK